MIYVLAAFLYLQHTDRPLDYAAHTAIQLLDFLPVRLPMHPSGIGP